MLARIVAVVDEPHAAVDEPHGDWVRFTFDYNENRDHNLALDIPTWFIGITDKQGTAIEDGYFARESTGQSANDMKETILYDPKDTVPVELVADGTPLAEYLASGSKLSYIEWLEAKVKELDVSPPA